MQTKRNIFLIGLMGAGKTTIGKALADELHLKFYDSDHEIEVRTGADIPWIFDIEGEEGFRLREKKVVDELTRREGVVLATGGGVVLDRENRQALAGRGTVIYLKAGINDLINRTGRNQNRPLLANKKAEPVLQQLLLQRGPLYEELADLIYDTSQSSIHEIVHHIVRDLRNQC